MFPLVKTSLTKGSPTVKVLTRRYTSPLVSSIKNLLSPKDQEKVNDGTLVNVNGWVKTCRVQKKYTFLELTDGTSVQPLHIVTDSDKIDRCFVVLLFLSS